MSGKNGGNRSPWRAAALAIAAAVAVLTTACSLVHVHLGSSGGSALSIRQDTRRRDRGTGQLEAGS